MVVARVVNETQYEWLLLCVAVTFVPAVVNCWKGKPWWGLACLLGIFWRFTYGAAIRLAKPDSWWALKLYDEKAMARSRERFAEK
jgi:hypothetical protein